MGGRRSWYKKSARNGDDRERRGKEGGVEMRSRPIYAHVTKSAGGRAVNTVQCMVVARKAVCIFFFI